VGRGDKVPCPTLSSQVDSRSVICDKKGTDLNFQISYNSVINEMEDPSPCFKLRKYVSGGTIDAIPFFTGEVDIASFYTVY
jgi:hypothetical protein